MKPTAMPRWMISATAVLACFFMAAQTPLDPFAPEQKTEPKKREFPVKMAVESGKRDAEEKQRIVVCLEILAPYYVFANPASADSDFPGEPVVLKVSGKGKPEVIEINYPKGEKVVDKLVGDYFIYKKKVELVVVVKRAKDDAEPISVSVVIRPFDDKGCYWGRKTLTQEVP